MTETTDKAVAELVERLRKLDERATAGPWVWEQCGDKCDAPVVGIAYRHDDADCLHPLAGLLRDFDADGEPVEYYRETIATDWVYCDGVSPSANASLVVALRNELPTLLSTIAALATDKATLEAENARLREALTPSGETKYAYIGEFSWTEEIMAAIRGRAALSEYDRSEAVSDLISGDAELVVQERCPTCTSPSPERHPAVQHEGEVSICTDAFHLTPTNMNRPEYIAAVERKRAEQDGDADNTPHAYSYGAPDTCRHCGNRKAHPAHTDRASEGEKL